MKLVSYNIQYGKGQDGLINLPRIAEEVRGADIIALQEVDRYWPHTGMIDQVARLGELLPDYYSAYGAGVDMHVAGDTPVDGRRRQFGNLLLSRYPLLRIRHHLLPKRGSVEALSIQRSAIEATIGIGDARLRFYSVHLCHLASATRLPQVARLLDIHQSAVHEGAAMCGNLSGIAYADGVDDQRVPYEAIMMGDFNCQPDSREYLEIVGPLSDYGGRVSPLDGFADAWVAAGNARNTGFTSDVRDTPAILDYCFVSTDLQDRIRSCHLDDTAVGSDHFPVWTDIDL